MSIRWKLAYDDCRKITYISIHFILVCTIYIILLHKCVIYTSLSCIIRSMRISANFMFFIWYVRTYLRIYATSEPQYVSKKFTTQLKWKPYHIFIAHFFLWNVAPHPLALSNIVKEPLIMIYENKSFFLVKIICKSKRVHLKYNRKLSEGCNQMDVVPWLEYNKLNFHLVKLHLK